MAKPGCGVVGAILIVLVTILIFGGNEAVGIYFSECPEEEIMDCLFEVLDDKEEEAPEGSVAAAGTYEYKGYAATLTLNIPLTGGNVTGSMTGACEGSVKANYTGAEGGLISGKVSGTCDPFFVKIPASADFSGSVNKRGRTVTLPFNGRGGGIEHSGTFNLSWQERAE